MVAECLLVTQSGHSLEYVIGYTPTQFIAERFKREGYDGIVYKSDFGEAGYNIVLFDPDVAECVSGRLFKAKAINIEFEETANPYFIQPKDKDQSASEDED